MNTKDVKTMTGLTMAEAIAKLDEQLPPDAYSAVPGGAEERAKQTSERTSGESGGRQ